MYHQDLTAEKWAKLTLSEQLGNVGSEVSRMIKWRGKDNAIAERAFERMLELMDLTLQSQTNGSRLREIARSREMVVSSWLENDKYTDSNLAYLNKYFLQFALLACQHRII
ncbi:MAG: hypothetical protein V1719_01110 [Patescibacteria group bacterium]